MSERQKLASIGLLATIFIFYLIWSGMTNSVSILRQRIATQQKTLQWMQTADRELQRNAGIHKSENTITSSAELSAYMQTQINQAGLTSQLVELKEAANNTVELHFKKINFDKTIQLLTQIVREQPISITYFSAAADGVPGVVTADLVLGYNNKSADNRGV